MDFKLVLTPLERDAYADRAGTTVRYTSSAISSLAEKFPRPRSMHKLAPASEDSVSLDELLAYFYKANKETKHKQF